MEMALQIMPEDQKYQYFILSVMEILMEIEDSEFSDIN